MSVFARENLHLGPQAELSGGVRPIWSKFPQPAGDGARRRTDGGARAFISPLLPTCAAAEFGSACPAFCDVPMPGQSLPAAALLAKKQPLIYNLSVRHRVREDLMIYFSTGAGKPPILSPSRRLYARGRGRVHRPTAAVSSACPTVPPGAWWVASSPRAKPSPDHVGRRIAGILQ